MTRRLSPYKQLHLPDGGCSCFFREEVVLHFSDIEDIIDMNFQMTGSDGMQIKSEQNSGNLLFFAWAIAVTATLGSLYFSEVMQYEPCELCWYQRILMYPLVIVLGIASVKRDAGAALYSMVFSGIGVLVSLYHYLIQKVSFLANQAPECGRVPCTGEYVNLMGFITIPFMAFISFSMILISSMVLYRKVKEARS